MHLGHLFIAETAREFLAVERVLFMPVRLPRHRRDLHASPEDRLAMLRAALAPNPAFAVDETDMTSDASGFSVDMLTALHRRLPDHQLHFLVGEDALTAAPWHRFDDVLQLVHRFVVARRDEGSEKEGKLEAFIAAHSEQARERFTVLDQPRVPISATAIRERVSRRETIRYLVPETVRRYIADHRLYAEGSS